MKLLLSCYACAPGKGSEHAVGWNWVTEAARLGHQVWAFASPAHRSAILAACASDPSLAGISWHFPDVHIWKLPEGQDAVWERSHNLLWQARARQLARDLQRRVGFDVVHHLTWGGLRAPTFLGGLGIPLIIGPTGGGETSPAPLRRDLRLKARLTETVRDLSNATIMLNPMVRGGLRKATRIYVKTPETRDILPRRMRAKCVLYPELTIAPGRIGQARVVRTSPPRLLFAGRLLYWKGAHLAVQAFARLRQHFPGARMTIVGRGPEEQRLKDLVATLDMAGAVYFFGHLPQPRLFELYEEHDLLVFPSLHDSSGNVVLESLSRGLPVLCLDVGGPRQIVTESCGIIVPTGSHDAACVSQAMADRMVALFNDPAELQSLSVGAVSRARDFLVHKQVGRFYDMVAASLGVTVPAAGPREMTRELGAFAVG